MAQSGEPFCTVVLSVVEYDDCFWRQFSLDVKLMVGMLSWAFMHAGSSNVDAFKSSRIHEKELLIVRLPPD